MNKDRFSGPAAIGLLMLLTLLPLSVFAGQSNNRVSPGLFSAMDITVSKDKPKLDPVVLPDLSGRIIQSDRQPGRLVLVVFWAAWCGDCRREMPTLSKLYTKFKDQGLRILAVDLLETPDTVRRFKNEFALDFPILLDLKGEFGRRFNLHEIPSTFLLDGQGRLIGKATGYHDWSSTKADKLIAALLAADPKK